MRHAVRAMMGMLVAIAPLAGTLRVEPLWAADGPDVRAEQVRSAIERGVAWLKREQSPRGTWNDMPGQPGGVTALCTLALLNAGVPADDPHVRKALVALRDVEPKMTYTTALQTMVFCAAEPERDLQLILDRARWLEKTQIRSGDRKGVWSYPGASGDNSNGQFALLALHEAERVGIDVDDTTWERAHEYWKDAQRDDGSWGYVKGQPGTGSMTSAGVTSLVITSGRINARDANVVGGNIQCCAGGEGDDDVERALAWLGRNFSVGRNPGGAGRDGAWHYYYLYGLERVGRMTARRLIGGHDWYRAGAAHLIAKQDSLAGFWKGTGHAETRPEIATSFALLFLSKGRRPVVVSKLRSGVDAEGTKPDWNRHRNDLDHLTRYTEKKWDRELTWQVIDGDAADVDDLLQTPVLFMSGQNVPVMTDRQKRDLREYFNRGGFFFAVATCGGDPFDRGFRALMDDVFDETEYRLRLLPPEHPVWHAEERVDPGFVRPLWGIDYGCRTCVVYCPEDLSCRWELGPRDGRRKWPEQASRDIGAVLAMGVNVLTYATGREPRYKDAIPRKFVADPTAGDAARGTLYVAKLKHAGGCNAAPAALANLLRKASSELKLPVHTGDRQIAITDPALFKHHLVFMHGRSAFRLSAEERQALRKFLERGGTLLADAICSNRDFATSFRREMKAILPDRPLVRIPPEHVLFTPELGGYDIRTVSRRDAQGGGAAQPLRARIRRVPPDLEGARVDDRYAVIFSPYDLSCALEEFAALECDGYTREDAARIGLNVILYSLYE